MKTKKMNKTKKTTNSTRMAKIEILIVFVDDFFFRMPKACFVSRAPKTTQIHAAT